ncbi:MAG: MoxR family ATPase [Bdellovibrionota bacterium]
MSRKTTQRSAKDVVAEVQKKQGIIGREKEISQLWTAISAGRNALIEGPVGVGKTALAQAVASVIGRKVIRVDGDSRFTEQKLVGWFDPSLVLKKGYTEKTFIAGPLVEAMRSGSILFINELNRMPEAVQNVLLPAIDEALVQIPQLSEVRAKPGFLVVATQNPREFVATSHLSEALMDRMEWVQLGYQGFEEEREIAKQASKFSTEPYLSWAVALVRLTRSHPKIKRGASIRAAIAILQMLEKRDEEHELSESDFWEVAKLALPTRIELNTIESEGGYEHQVESLLRELWDELKKNSPKSSLTLSH